MDRRGSSHTYESMYRYLGMKSEMDVAMNPLAVSLHILGEIGITDFSAEIFKKYYKWT